MNAVAGPSRAPPSGRPAPRGRVESTYEEDLQGLLNQLSLDEMDEIQTFFTRRTRDGAPLSDHDIAMNDLLHQARALALLNQDRALAQRIAAGEDVGVGVDQTPAQTPGAIPRPTDNRRTATQRNGNQQHGAQPVRNNTVPSQTWGGWLSSVVVGWFSLKPVSSPGPTNTGTAAPRTPVVNRPTGHDCVICQDPIHGAEVRAPCGHYYDIGCVTDLFQSATRDETLYPPRCCRQNIPFPQVQPHLSQTLIATFQQKQVEFSTLKRVYCSSPACSRFLGPISEGIFTSKVYVCPAPGCGRRTCGKCRELHSGDWAHVCRPDAEAADVLALGNAAGWARCPGCSQMIELHIGCFHMTCRCRTEFCYLCHARWKTCQCPQWDERRLLAVAEERVDAQLGVARGVRRNPPALPPRPVPAPVPVPAGHRRAPVENARVVIPGARPPVPVPGLAQRPAAAAAPVPPPAPRWPPTVQLIRPQPTPARTPTAGASTTSTGHPASLFPQPRHPDVRPVNTASTSTARSPPAPSWSQILHPQPAPARTPTAGASTSARTPTNTVTTASTSMSASASGSSSGQARRPTSVHGVDTHNTDAMRQRMVREMMDRLRVDHDCDHKRWRYRHGGGPCQSCGHNLPLYLFRCLGCEMLACNRCRRNRL